MLTSTRSNVALGGSPCVASHRKPRSAMLPGSLLEDMGVQRSGTNPSAMETSLAAPSTRSASEKAAAVPDNCKRYVVELAVSYQVSTQYGPGQQPWWRATAGMAAAVRRSRWYQTSGRPLIAGAVHVITGLPHAAVAADASDSNMSRPPNPEICAPADVSCP